MIFFLTGWNPSNECSLPLGAFLSGGVAMGRARGRQNAFSPGGFQSHIFGPSSWRYLDPLRRTRRCVNWDTCSKLFIYYLIIHWYNYYLKSNYNHYSIGWCSIWLVYLYCMVQCMVKSNLHIYIHLWLLYSYYKLWFIYSL